MAYIKSVISILNKRYARSVHASVHQVQTIDWFDFHKQFASEEDCVVFMYSTKWPNGFQCPECDHNKAYTIRSRRLPLYQCCSCRHQTSLTVNTIMEGSRTPLYKWLKAIFLSSRNEHGTNASQLCKLIGVTYKTAWSMLNLIRYAINEADVNQPLSGKIKGDLGICSQLPFSATLKLRPQEKPVFVAASLDEHEQPIQIKMKLIALNDMEDSHLLKSGILAFKERHVEKNTENFTFVPRVEFSTYTSISGRGMLPH